MGQPDWNREKKRILEWAPSRSFLASYRSYHRYRRAPGPFAALARLLAKRRCQFWGVVCGADIHLDATLGGGLRMPHPNGIVMHKDVVIGVNCMVMQQVTLGQLAKGGAPRLGDGVYIGAGAKVLGPISLGDGAAVGANAVVLNDVPANATAVGVPARVVRSREARPNSASD